MHKILSSDIWREIGRRAKGVEQRKAAIAYVTKDQIGLQALDVLVVDASRRAIASGQTDAKLLRELDTRGVAIYSREGLHAKILRLGAYTVVGSANMSASSDALVEVAVITDSDVVASGVESFITQHATKRTRLTPDMIEVLCKIEVVRTGWTKGGKPSKPQKRIRSLGNRTWIVGVNELVRDPPADEQKHIDRAVSHLNQRSNAAEDDYEWIRWGKNGKFAAECREGDTLIRIYNKRNRTRQVTCGIPVLLRRSEPKWVRFYLGDKLKKSDNLSWTQFQEVLRKIGYSRSVGKLSVQRLNPKVAELLQAQWRRHARTAAKPKA